MRRQLLNARPIRRLFSNFVPIEPKAQPLRTLAQTTAIVGGTIFSYVSYQIYQGKPVFLPLWISRSTRSAGESHVDDKFVRLVAEEQILQKLSLDGTIQEEFRLPIRAKLHDPFEIWTEERHASLKGIKVSPGPRFEVIHRPMEVWKVETLLENLGGEDKFEIPVVNANKLKDEDVWFLGTVTIEGQNQNVGEVVFRGIFDAEHINQARITNAHLIRQVGGHKTRTVLWDR